MVVCLRRGQIQHLACAARQNLLLFEVSSEVTLAAHDASQIKLLQLRYVLCKLEDTCHFRRRVFCYLSIYFLLFGILVSIDHPRDEMARRAAIHGDLVVTQVGSDDASLGLTLLRVVELQQKAVVLGTVAKIHRRHESIRHALPWLRHEVVVSLKSWLSLACAFVDLDELVLACDHDIAIEEILANKVFHEAGLLCVEVFDFSV